MKRIHLCIAVMSCLSVPLTAGQRTTLGIIFHDAA